MNKTSILFLCTGNSARSQMAEAFLKKYGEGKYNAYSAGLEPKEIHPYTKQVMGEEGMSLSGQYSKHVKEYMGRVHFAYMITMCDEAEKSCPAIFPGTGKLLHWSFEDPSVFEGSEEEKLEKFREIRDQIERRIKIWLEEEKLKVTT